MFLQWLFFNSTEKNFEAGPIMKWNVEKVRESSVLQEYLLTHLLLWLTLAEPVNSVTSLKFDLC